MKEFERKPNELPETGHRDAGRRAHAVSRTERAHDGARRDCREYAAHVQLLRKQKCAPSDHRRQCHFDQTVVDLPSEQRDSLADDSAHQDTAGSCLERRQHSETKDLPNPVEFANLATPVSASDSEHSENDAEHHDRHPIVGQRFALNDHLEPARNPELREDDQNADGVRRHNDIRKNQRRCPSHSRHDPRGV